MKNYRVFLLLFLFCPAVMLSCSQGLGQDDFPPDPGASTELSHDEIVLGERLDDPYAVENMQRAYASLYPTKAREEIQPTDYYVRFLPEDEGQLSELLSRGIQLLDHPFDYQIIKEGDYYHDPDIAEDNITWQYAVVPADFEFPSGIRSEIIHPCFLSENSPATRSSDGIDWEAVEREAFLITGNGGLLEEKVKGGEVQPQGRITIVDPAADGGQPVGVAGVTVSCNVFAKFSSAFTDRDGYYKIPRTFSGTPRYRLVFKNSKGFSIGFNSILYPASISTLGTNPASGVSVDVNQDSERKLFRRCAVNNAAYDFLRRCDISDLNLPMPPTNLCFWLFDEMDRSSAIMLHHGTILDTESSNTIFKIVSWVVNFFAPDITLGTRDCKSCAEFYSYVCHEMAHACHFNKVGASYWNKYIQYIALCALRGQTVYGDGTLEGSGICAVGEMWAYYLQSKIYKERYGGDNPSFGSGYWFHPQILTALEDRGIQTAGIFAALDADVKSKDALRSRLGEMYPAKKTSIDQIFNRYD